MLRAPVSCVRTVFNLSIDESEQLKKVLLCLVRELAIVYTPLRALHGGGITMQKESDSTECLQQKRIIADYSRKVLENRRMG